ncbi:MAG: DNA/RNA nuclease SfsA [Pseudomonadota bacterium]|nr:DNA/RNA nuclease SfsA [Pseudomonadota bacterium]
MRFPDPLIPGTLIKRYKRFLADITLQDGFEITAHCANTGSMLGVQEPGSEVWVSPANNPKRKLQYSWELVRVGSGLVGINTGRANHLAAEAITASAIPELTGYRAMRREVKYGKNSRIDLLLSEPEKPDCYVEVKSVTLKRGKLAEFPDSVTARDTKHLGELVDRVRKGERAVMLYVIQRGDVNEFAVAADIDSAYAEALDAARAAGVEALCYRCRVAPDSIMVDVPVDFRTRDRA